MFEPVSIRPPSEPDWIAVLREACAASSQRRVATRLGVSCTLVNQVLSGKYRNPEVLAERVRGELMEATVECPALWLISTRRCEDAQRRPFAATNPTRVAVWRACRRGCHRYRGQNQRGGAR